jgi:hypothetical protein
MQHVEKRKKNVSGSPEWKRQGGKRSCGWDSNIKIGIQAAQYRVPLAGSRGYAPVSSFGIRPAEREPADVPSSLCGPGLAQSAQWQDYGLGDQEIRVRILARIRHLPPERPARSLDIPGCFSAGNRGSFPVGKAARA